ncbi:MAG: PEP-CTERM/exosortase system-associated acyltransferase [Halioglobus sp.]
MESLVDKKATSLVDDFQEYFDLGLATTPPQLESVYRVRYRVYCEEFKYEPADSFPSQQEKDEFDDRSSHCLVTHKLSKMPAGCARLVHADENSQLPMEKFCSASMDEKIIRSFDGRRDTICEFSRLGVDGAFRRRPGEHVTRFGEISSLDCTKREQRTFSLIAVSTILSAFAMSDLIGRPHCFAMMEPFLPRLLRRSGITVHPAGEEMEYHGIRAPYYFETHATVAGMKDEMRGFYEVIRADFANSGLFNPTEIPAARKTGRTPRREFAWLHGTGWPILAS